MLMKTFESRSNDGSNGPAGWRWWAGILLVFVIGCGPGEETFSETETPEEARQEVLLSNGLSLNGLNLNGLNLNGLNLNGLNLNGLSTTSFHNWFQVNAALRAEVMKYLVECAVPAGSTRTYTSPSTGTTYTWNGVLGLAPNWSSGLAATTAELQVVSACMAAHANKYGLHVTVSLRGLNGSGSVIATTSAEVTSHTLREGCFFGNLFDGSTGVFGGNDGLTLAAQQSSPRVCGLPGTSPTTSQCAPMVYVGSCSQYCTLDSSQTYYTSCVYNGVTYRPVTTKMKPSDIATCGNGVCEQTEKSGLPTYCSADCGG
ncbi:hypothetical protein D187_009325 [Cystobacter fuscus DSM 2262]|uniref:Uncharacterized protein n=1 Tax=Cystobacter fuscus (strain ATCC 25194 / DSM 2262 / NBRC 100088 / M29) TaxID=1242864 RepID=S9NT76_CYSF2|nr:hypothetical protein [Cystobacter fuscus]EPX55330.1 hypothetical protein D187_009325 [Cystobacter fuscus DSM 2262]